MKMPFDDAEDIQHWLVCMFGVDDYTPEFIAHSVPTGKEVTSHQWQSAVDLIYRLVSAGLLELWPDGMLAGKSDLTFDGPLGFAQELAKQNPFSFEEVNEKPVPWIGPHLCLTDKAKRLIAKHGMSDPCQDYPLNVAFIEEMEGMFEAAGVPWSEGPMVPIRSASPSLQG